MYEFDERHDALAQLDFADRGNVDTRLVRCPDEASTLDRFADSVHQVLGRLPECDLAVLSSAEVAFLCHGLEVARARISHESASFRSDQEIAFGVGAEERVLDDRNAPIFDDLIRRLRSAREPKGPRHHQLFRLHPERWLESLVVRDVTTIDEQFDPSCLYSQVPAFSASDRAMLDLLATTRDHRLAVVELKADEDIHLPLQGLDYWSRVQWHHARGEFQQFGYFPGRELSSADPLLFLVAPTLHIHPATDSVLRHLAPEIDWTLVGIDERWRDGVRAIFRKRAKTQDLPRRQRDTEETVTQRLCASE